MPLELFTTIEQLNDYTALFFFCAQESSTWNNT